MALGRKLAARLELGDTVLLYGNLGAGKTHFTKGIAEGLGIEMTVKSPTFTIVNSYELSDMGFESGRVNHFDLYRFEEGVDLTEVGFDEAMEDPNSINVVEWADRLADQLPRHHIVVSIEGVEEKRTIQIQFNRTTQVPESKVEVFYKEWKTPMHVRSHCKQVASAARQLGEAFARAGEIVDMNLIIQAGLLHDLCRVCDFRDMDRKKFEEEITDEKWAFWHDLRGQYEGGHHADIADEWLKEKGFFQTAEVIRLHRFRSIVEEQHSFDSLEKKIVHYADKRAKHDEIVSIAERFKDARARYDRYNSDEDRKLFEMVEEKTVELERELFEKLDIEPGDVH